jgi:DNA-binding CsgD family transcriptional regulator
MAEKARGGERTNARGLSRRESEMLRLIGQGLASKEIAVRLELSPSTVASYRKGLCRKLDLHSTSELALHAARIYDQSEQE